jgi:hypothetical protein
MAVIAAHFSMCSVAFPQVPFASTLSDLRRLPGKAVDAPSDVPQRAAALMKTLNSQLQSLVVSTVQSPRVGSNPAPVVRARLAETFRAGGIVVGEQPDPQKELGYGHILDLAVSTPDGHNDLLTVTIAVSTTCGANTSMYLFRRVRELWSPILVDQVSDYRAISDAHSIYQLKVSPTTPDGSFFILTTWVPPACWSVWRSVQYRLYRMSPSMDKPVQLTSAWTEALAIDDGYEIKAEQDGFTIGYKANNERDPGMRIRENLRLRVEGNQVIASRSRPGG